MEPIRPGIDAPEQVVGAASPVHRPMIIAVAEADDGEPVIVTRWRLTDEERTRMAAGEDIFVYVVPTDGRLPPMQVHVGSAYHAYASNTGAHDRLRGDTTEGGDHAG